MLFESKINICGCGYMAVISKGEKSFIYIYIDVLFFLVI